MNLNTPIGSDIIFTGVGDKKGALEAIQRGLRIGEKYVVSKIVIKPESSVVILKELPGIHFNTVLFKNLPEHKEFLKGTISPAYAEFLRDHSSFEQIHYFISELEALLKKYNAKMTLEQVGEEASVRIDFPNSYSNLLLDTHVDLTEMGEVKTD